MVDKNDSRRILLKSIAAGPGAVVAGKTLPESWSKPVIDSVMLPAHAATTDDSGSGGEDTTTTTTMEPCAIEGEYCWVEGSNARTIIAVTSDGDITITRTLTRPAYTWIGTGVASNGAMGGTFSIQIRSAELPNNVRVFTGTVVCNSTRIEGTSDNPSNPDPAVNYEATQEACSSVPG